MELEESSLLRETEELITEAKSETAPCARSGMRMGRLKRRADRSQVGKKCVNEKMK